MDRGLLFLSTFPASGLVAFAAFVAEGISSVMKSPSE
jgi:hypothetical protein